MWCSILVDKNKQLTRFLWIFRSENPLAFHCPFARLVFAHFSAPATAKLFGFSFAVREKIAFFYSNTFKTTRTELGCHLKLRVCECGYCSGAHFTFCVFDVWWKRPVSSAKYIRMVCMNIQWHIGKGKPWSGWTSGVRQITKSLQPNECAHNT